MTRKQSSSSKGSSSARPKSSRKALVKVASPQTLVTGATGFLGSYLVRKLVNSGQHNLKVLTRNPVSWLSDLGVEVVTGSILDVSDVARACEGVESMYHLAGLVSRARSDAREMYAVHVDGTRLLVEAARAQGAKTIVLTSTSGTIAVTEKGAAIPDETWKPPLDIISRWPYYASKLYQERAALEGFSGQDRRLVIVNPSLLLGPGDERLSSTKLILDFLGRKIKSVPSGGLNFVDVRDVAEMLPVALERGRHGERYLLGSVNWTFEKFLGRLSRLSDTPAPRLTLPSKLAVAGASAIHALYKHWDLAPPLEPEAIEMAEYFWYLDYSKAAREFGFSARDPATTLLDTISYTREHFLGAGAFGP